LIRRRRNWLACEARVIDRLENRQRDTVALVLDVEPHPVGRAFRATLSANLASEVARLAVGDPTWVEVLPDRRSVRPLFEGSVVREFLENMPVFPMILG
jgi:hypothetical protein